MSITRRLLRLIFRMLKEAVWSFVSNDACFLKIAYITKPKSAHYAVVGYEFLAGQTNQCMRSSGQMHFFKLFTIPE